jgi:hypothetical protein
VLLAQLAVAIWIGLNSSRSSVATTGSGQGVTDGSGYLWPSERNRQQNRYPDSWQGIKSGVGTVAIFGGIIYIIAIGINTFAPWIWHINTVVHP